MSFPSKTREQLDLDKRCLSVHVEDMGRHLTAAEKETALQVAAENWTGSRTAGEAVHVGLEAVRAVRERR